MKKYYNLTLDEERALYGCFDAEIDHCLFDGPADGESALKECGSQTAIFACAIRFGTSTAPPSKTAV